MSSPSDLHPDLVLSVHQDDQDGLLTIQLRVQSPRLGLGLVEEHYEPVKLSGSPETYLASLFRHIEHIEGLSFVDEDGQTEERFAGIGVDLAEKLLPEKLRERLWRLREKKPAPSCLLISNALWIPWELLKLRNPDENALETKGPFLVEAFALTRWIEGRPQTLELPIRKMALVMLDDLETVALEGERLHDLDSDVTDVPARRGELFDALASGHFDGWHFSLHGVLENDNADLQGFVLDDDTIFTATDLADRARGLGQTCPWVFLNTCHSIQSGLHFTGGGGLAQAFLRAGAGALLGVHWAILDNNAGDFALMCYEPFFAGAPLGESVRQARAQFRKEYPGNPLWLAYAVFGHPLATRVRPARQSSERPSAAGITTAEEPDPAEHSLPSGPGKRELLLANVPGKPYFHFVGRGEWIASLLRLLKAPGEPSIFAIHGMGGIGKTALAHGLVRNAIAKNLFDHVVWHQSAKTESFREMHSEPGASMTFESILEEIGIQTRSRRLLDGRVDERLRFARHLLNHERVLLVLDNTETASEPQEDIVPRLRSIFGSTHSKVLMTTRRRLQHEVYSVPLRGLVESDALLFLRQEASWRNVRHVENSPDEILRRITKSTGGSPLAMKFAVGKLQSLTLDDVLDQLRDVKAPDDDMEEDEYIAFYYYLFLPSWRLLSKVDRDLAILISQFPPGIGSEKSWLHQVSQIEERAFLSSLDRLWQYSFLERTEPENLEDARYFFHHLTYNFIRSDIVEKDNKRGWSHERDRHWAQEVIRSWIRRLGGTG